MHRSPTSPPPGSGPWPRAAQLAAATLLGAAVVLLGIHVWGYLGWGSRPTELETGRAPAYRIDLNRSPVPSAGRSSPTDTYES